MQAIINVGFDASFSFDMWVIPDPEIAFHNSNRFPLPKPLNNRALLEFEIDDWDLISLDLMTRVNDLLYLTPSLSFSRSYLPP